MFRLSIVIAGAAILFAPTLAAAVDPPGFVRRWGGTGTIAGRFLVPDGVDCDQLGNVYVAEFNNHRVQKFTNDGVYVTRWGSFGKNDGNLDSPAGPLRALLPPVLMEDTEPVMGPIPSVGQHTDEILTEIGIDAATIAVWRRNGVV